jgi:hypothetical protein
MGKSWRDDSQHPPGQLSASHAAGPHIPPLQTSVPVQAEQGAPGKPDVGLHVVEFMKSFRTQVVPEPGKGGKMRPSDGAYNVAGINTQQQPPQFVWLQKGAGGGSGGAAQTAPPMFVVRPYCRMCRRQKGRYKQHSWPRYDWGEAGVPLRFRRMSRSFW